jgi:hypothetical protein
MQFINNDPDIPEALLQAHEEGRVVFFCGAGHGNPPFNRKDWRWEKEFIEAPCLRSHEVPPKSNANYAWILNSGTSNQYFFSRSVIRKR